MKNLIKCDDCGHEFKLKKLKTENLENTVQRVYFECPKGKKQYTSYYTDYQVRLNQQEISKLSSKMQKLKGEAYLKLHEEMNKLIEFNKERMAKLKAKYEA